MSTNCPSGLYDSHHRKINYLRISVTDRCNLDCIYCSGGALEHWSHSDLLSYEEIARVAKILVSLGVNHIRLTGGEPLARPKVDILISMLAALNGIEDISMTTNGTLLERWAEPLKKCGLNRVNVSLDSLLPRRFCEITRGGDLTKVLAGIESAKKAGLTPVKVNTVVMRGVNDDEILDFARWGLTKGAHVRFIECMPFSSPIMSTEGINVEDIKMTIESHFGDLNPVYEHWGVGPAKYYKFATGDGSIGFIRPVSECFCDECNRLRLTADGKLRLCLLDDSELDLKPFLRGGASDLEIEVALKQSILTKPARHRLDEGMVPGRLMRQIGG